MRFLLAIISVVFSASLSAQDQAPADLVKTRQDIERLRTLVEAGALPRNALSQAEGRLADIQDEQILRQTLYASLGIEDLTEEQAAQMIEAAGRLVARQQQRLVQLRKLVDLGVSAEDSLTADLEELDRRKLTVDLAEARARLFRQLAEAVHSEEALAATEAHPAAEEEGTKIAERYDGDGSFTDGDFKKVVKAYEKEFDHPLPVSAKGETVLHRSLGFDHRGKVDVALNPDTKEGVWLRRFLESARIPYFAFRRAIPGKATAAHIHIGTPSNRLRVAD